MNEHLTDWSTFRQTSYWRNKPLQLSPLTPNKKTQLELYMMPKMLSLCLETQPETRLTINVNTTCVSQDNTTSTCYLCISYLWEIHWNGDILPSQCKYIIKHDTSWANRLKLTEWSVTTQSWSTTAEEFQNKYPALKHGDFSLTFTLEELTVR